MTHIAPMPQEFALGHAARFDFLFPSGLCVLETNAKKPKEPKLVTLAKGCGLNPEHYACNHSLMPFFRMVARGDQPAPHGHLGMQTFTRRSGTAVPINFARICPQCVSGDLNHWYFTWYRRTHQLPGVDWCPVHRCPLMVIGNTKPWHTPPHHWIDQEQVRPLQIEPEVITEDCFLGRLVEIACDLLERPAPLPVGCVGAALTELVQDMGLRISQDGAKPLLSDLVLERAPSFWLKQHWAGLAGKRRGEIYSGLDRVVSRTIPATGLAYVTALATMFDSASDALNFFTAATQKTGRTPKPGPIRTKIRPDTFWEGEFWPLYKHCSGNINDIARNLQMDRTHLAQKLRRYGMPSLNDCERDPRWLALLRFQAGASLSTACKQENVCLESVEALLRFTSPRVIELVRAIVQGTRSKPPTKNLEVHQGLGQDAAGQFKLITTKQKTSKNFNIDEVAQHPKELANSL